MYTGSTKFMYLVKYNKILIHVQTDDLQQWCNRKFFSKDFEGVFGQSTFRSAKLGETSMFNIRKVYYYVTYHEYEYDLI